MSCLDSPLNKINHWPAGLKMNCNEFRYGAGDHNHGLSFGDFNVERFAGMLQPNDHVIQSKFLVVRLKFLA